MRFSQRRYNQKYPWHTLKTGESFTVPLKLRYSLNTAARFQGIQLDFTPNFSANTVTATKVGDLSVFYVDVAGQKIRVQALNQVEANKLALELVTA